MCITNNCNDTKHTADIMRTVQGNSFTIPKGAVQYNILVTGGTVTINTHAKDATNNINSQAVTLAAGMSISFSDTRNGTAIYTTTAPVTVDALNGIAIVRYTPIASTEI